MHSDQYAEQVEALADASVFDGEPSRPTALVLGEIERLVRAGGATPVFILGPTLDMQEEVVRAHRAGVIEHLLAYNRPDAYPELYAVENRFEQSHLNATGARIYTRHLAEDLVALMDARESAR